MANFKYIKIPMGYSNKFIRVNCLSNYALMRLSKGEFTNSECNAIKDFDFKKIKEARGQAWGILKRRGL